MVARVDDGEGSRGGPGCAGCRECVFGDQSARTSEWKGSVVEVCCEERCAGNGKGGKKEKGWPQKGWHDDGVIGHLVELELLW